MELLVLQLMHKVLGTQDLCLIQYIYSFKDNFNNSITNGISTDVGNKLIPNGSNTDVFTSLCHYLSLYFYSNIHDET